MSLRPYGPGAVSGAAFSTTPTAPIGDCRAQSPHIGARRVAFDSAPLRPTAPSAVRGEVTMTKVKAHWRESLRAVWRSRLRHSLEHLQFATAGRMRASTGTRLRGAVLVEGLVVIGRNGSADRPSRWKRKRPAAPALVKAPQVLTRQVRQGLAAEWAVQLEAANHLKSLSGGRAQRHRANPGFIRKVNLNFYRWRNWTERGVSRTC